MNQRELEPQPIPEVYRKRAINKALSNPKKRAIVVQPEDASYRIVPLTKNQIAFVDTEDYERISQHGWQAHWSKETQTFYAQRATRINGKQVHISMHREIMLITDTTVLVDHANRNLTLDNRKVNLRVANRSQNGFNSKKPKNNTSGFKGVHFNKLIGKWQAQITVNYKHKHLGLFSTPELAHKAYCKAADELHGEFARY